MGDMEAPDVFYTIVVITMIAKIVARRGQVFLVSGFLLEPERDGGGGVRGHGWWRWLAMVAGSTGSRKLTTLPQEQWSWDKHVYASGPIGPPGE